MTDAEKLEEMCCALERLAKAVIKADLLPLEYGVVAPALDAALVTLRKISK